MTDFLTKPVPGGIVRLSGEIKNYRCTRSSASFVYSSNHQRQLGVVAIAAAFAGMGGQAAATVAAASDVEEMADYVEFDLDGQQIKGWVWRSPFNDGDRVDIAAEWQTDRFEVYGIVRPVDKTIALYPHCSRSKNRHILNAIKWWVICNTLFFGFLAALLTCMGGLKIFDDPSVFWINGAVMAYFILMFVSLTRQYMPFVRVSQKVFIILGLPDPKNIDLVKSSWRQRTDQDPVEFGTFYFRY